MALSRVSRNAKCLPGGIAARFGGADVAADLGVCDGLRGTPEGLDGHQVAHIDAEGLDGHQVAHIDAEGLDGHQVAHIDAEGLDGHQVAHIDAEGL
ncbi:MAG TPA: hypothetical protein VMY42_29050, partial [Thermoguttaceae bacterium]|nr:hypothetical protein [Thermoguttaceae bacterium]